VGAGAALDLIWRHVEQRRYRALVVPGAILVALFALVNWRHGLHDGRWEEGLRMAERLAHIGRYEESDGWVRRMEPTEPRPGAVRYAVGLQLLAIGQPSRALPYLTEAAGKHPNRAAVEQALGQALLKLERPREALPYLTRGFEARVPTELAGYDLAFALKETGDLTRAAEVVRRMTPSEDDGAEVWLRAGRLAAQVRALDAADRFFQRGAALAPNDAAARQQYGLNLLLLGRFEQAATELTAAIRLDPRDPDSLAHLAYCEFKLGRMTDARAHADAALAIRPDSDLARQVRAALDRNR
jgi:tetratricopeptide (TPR) repeat protein